MIAGAALSASRPDIDVRTAGTLVVDGQPMSWRTRAAFEHAGLDLPSHRSHQACQPDLDAADLIVGLASEHVAWVRREHPTAASKAGTLRRLATSLPIGALATGDALGALALETVPLAPWEDVADPGGSESPVYAACAVEIVELVRNLAERL